eukprot:scaffold28205_cov85-Cyclotella_meneghiniana.AAC.3
MEVHVWRHPRGINTYLTSYQFSLRIATALLLLPYVVTGSNRSSTFMLPRGVRRQMTWYPRMDYNPLEVIGIWIRVPQNMTPYLQEDGKAG